MSRHFRNREPRGLERDLRDGPEPPPELVQRIVSRTRRSRPGVPHRRAIAAAVLSTGLLFALGAAGGLGSVSSAIKDGAGGVTKIIKGSDEGKSGEVGSDKGKPAKPARDQYTHPGNGCDVKRDDALATQAAKKHRAKKALRKKASKKHPPKKRKKPVVRKPPVGIPTTLPSVGGPPGPGTKTPDPGLTEPAKGTPSPTKGKPHPGKPRPCPVPIHKK